MERRSLNLVIPVFNEIEVVAALLERSIAVCEKTEMDWRIIFVDDGSQDGTTEWISNACHQHVRSVSKEDRSGKRISLVKLSRNFGQSAAILAGLEQTDSDCVVVMDGDLQDPPELISDMIDRWKAGDQVVVAQRASRDETFFRGLGFSLFHFLFQRISDLTVPHQTGNFCLLDQVVVDAICELPESHRYFPGLRALVGFRQSTIVFDRPVRAGGVPKQSLSRLFQYALDAIFGFSHKPHKILSMAGIGIFAVGLVIGFYFLAVDYLWLQNTNGMLLKALTTIVLTLGGMQLIAFGIIGEYVGRIYDEVRDRPQFLISSIIDTYPEALRQHDHAEQLEKLKIYKAA